MMDFFAGPIDTFNAEITAPPSKYITHRAFFISALIGGSVENPSFAEDCIYSLRALETLGAGVKENENSLSFDPIGEFNEKTLNVGNSGTTARFLMSLSLLSKEYITITGGESISKRPMDDSANMIERVGGRVEFLKNFGHLPLKVSGPIKSKSLEVQELKSSQLISGLLILSTVIPEGISIRLRNIPDSFGYIKTTLDTLGIAGILYEINENGIFLKQRNIEKNFIIRIPGDYASTSFFMIAAMLTGSKIEIRNLDNRIFQPDSEILRYLRLAGARIKFKGDSIQLEAKRLFPLNLDLTGTPDLFPIMAILAAGIDGVSQLRFSNSLRYKESDRIYTTSEMLKGLGVSHEIEGDMMKIKGHKIRGGEINSHGDHRIAMAGAIAGLVSEAGVTIHNFEVYGKSYPNFLEDIRRISK